MTDLVKELQRCAKCGKCRAVCPTFIVSRDEAKVARGRISLLEAIMEGRAVPTEYGREILMSCYGCMRCSAVCPSGVQIDLIVRNAREMLARQMGLSRSARFVFRRILPRRRVYDGAIGMARLLQRLLRTNAHQPLRHLPLFFQGKRNIPRIDARPALRGLREFVKGRGDIKVSLFLGCMLNYVYPEIAASIMHILELHGVDIILPRAQLCCGTPALAYGDVDAARALAQRNLECLEPNKVDAIVLGCASCELTMKRDYPIILKGAEQLAKKVYDISEFIHNFLGYSNLALDERITYHDPCHLRWGRGVSKPPREILRQSCRFVEMPRAGDCCGLGGSFSLTHYDVSCALGAAKVEAVRESGADIVATACPGCILQLRDQLAQHQMNIPVMHVAQVYEMSYLKGRDFPGSPARKASKTEL